MSDLRDAASDGGDVEAGRQRVRLTGLVLVGLLLLVTGYLVGVRSPWAAHHPRVATGTAQRVPADVPLAYFDDEHGDRVTFRLDDVVWRSGDRTGSDSIPPCLREPGQPVDVQAGLIEVTRPFGSGSYERVLSVTCPAG